MIRIAITEAALVAIAQTCRKGPCCT
jgi:hypothetical protein